ncbi:unnamed protein product (macronuclear) [Paramecium tetraurelia]|uniref:SUMO-activating enzyme subunit n=1 Tax=Paramecium tetraurelia TaxID=5888 RepID=Q2Q4G9_PARTE|nr:uncharacterized protein GSPATT00016402001 [Paramecium tetraurelia]ABB36602.1 ubiquitin-activating enzyme X [Paramecium tetraurelia]CAK81576.1 unnamed protein product [Paramecium tetraurelia]|eukprot:XP_001448973.1 hypothetical protein (macronuclear) [Paramecium tetraurelia strain d4-2]
MNKTLSLLYSPETYEKIRNSNILIIGVGGIGCELLKVLTNSGYHKMTILDLDTIEATNLNRQFYFRKEHVGMSKALVGKESVMKKHPDLDITAIHGSIFEEKYDVEFYTQFDFILCALDNALAREHLGRMCLKSNRILVDAGTGGFSGQANVVKRFSYQCNNCQPSKGAPQYAVCTIRASPSQPIHCVTYGMSLYNLLFGPLDESNVLAGLLDLAQVHSCDKTDEQLLQSLALRTFNKLFCEDIKQGIKGYVKDEEANAINQHKYPISYEEGMNDTKVYTTIDQSKIEEEDDKIQPFKYYVELFVKTFVKILQTPGVGSFKFDKDDWDSVKFVAATTNLRTYNFTKKFKDIDPRLIEGDKMKYLSVNEVRQIGGKIIPAIASTNAIAAAIQVSESKKVLEENWNQLRMNWIQPTYDKIAPTYLPEPYPTCNHCSPRNVYLHLYCNFDTTIFGTIVELAKSFGLNDYDIYGQSGTVYGLHNKQLKRDGANERIYNKLLSKFYLRDTPYANMIFSVFEQSPGKQYYWQLGCKLELIVMHRADIKVPQISKITKLETALEQLKQLKISKHQELYEARMENLVRFSF